MRLIRTLCLTALLLGPAAASAADEDQIQLTASMVENFIAAHAELATLAAALTKQYGDRSDTPGDDPVASLPAFQDIPDAKTRTQALLGKHGFKDLDELEIVTNSVMLAYQADVPDTGTDDQQAATDKSQDKSQVDIDAEKARAKAEVEADKSLSPEKKQEALQQIDDQYASLQALTPLPGNAEVVKSYLDKLKPIVDSN